MMGPFSLAASETFFFVFHSTMMCIGVNMFMSIFWIISPSWICRFMFSVNLGNFGLLFLQIFFLLLSLILFLIFPLHIYYTIVVVPQLLDILFSLMLLFYLHFRFGNSYGHFLKFSDFFFLQLSLY